MKHMNKSFCLLLLSLLLPGVLWAQDVRASLSSMEGYVGLPLQYTITVTGSKAADVPELSDFDDFTVTYAGQNKSSQTSIINGKRTSSVSVTFTWQLIPLKEGDLRVPPVSIDVDGKIFQTPSGTVHITPPRQVEGFQLKLESQQNKSYMGQSFSVNMDFYVSSEVGGLNFTLPGQAGESLEGEDFLILDSQMPDRGGNDIRQIPMGDRTFYGYVSSRYEEGTQYTILTVPLDIMPLKEGPLVLDGATVAFTVDEGSWPRSNIHSYVVPAEPLKLTIHELPGSVKNSPNGIILSSGELQVETALSSLEARPGDPLTLTVTLKGVVNPAYCEIPPLEEFTTLEEGFSLPQSQSKARIEGDSLILVQTIRPKSVDTVGIPAMNFTYMDLKSNKSRTLTTTPIALSMSSAGNLSVNDLEVFAKGEEGHSSLIANDRGIRQNKRIQDFIDRGDRRGTTLLSSQVYLALVLIPPGLFSCLLLILFISGLIHKKGERDRNNPYKQFMAALKKEESLLSSFEQYLRRRCFHGKAFSRQDLRNLGQKLELTDLSICYEALEESRFGGANTEGDKERVEKLVRELEVLL